MAFALLKQIPNLGKKAMELGSRINQANRDHTKEWSEAWTAKHPQGGPAGDRRIGRNPATGNLDYYHPNSAGEKVWASSGVNSVSVADHSIAEKGGASNFIGPTPPRVRIHYPQIPLFGLNVSVPKRFRAGTRTKQIKRMARNVPMANEYLKSLYKTHGAKSDWIVHRLQTQVQQEIYNKAKGGKRRKMCYKNRQR
jgi:hypothetical protein